MEDLNIKVEDPNKVYLVYQLDWHAKMLDMGFVREKGVTFSILKRIKFYATPGYPFSKKCKHNVK